MLATETDTDAASGSSTLGGGTEARTSVSSGDPGTSQGADTSSGSSGDRTTSADSFSSGDPPDETTTGGSSSTGTEACGEGVRIAEDSTEAICPPATTTTERVVACICAYDPALLDPADRPTDAEEPPPSRWPGSTFCARCSVCTPTSPRMRLMRASRPRRASRPVSGWAGRAQPGLVIGAHPDLCRRTDARLGLRHAAARSGHG